MARSGALQSMNEREGLGCELGVIENSLCVCEPLYIYFDRFNPMVGIEPGCIYILAGRKNEINGGLGRLNWRVGFHGPPPAPTRPP
ncbi:unnamed protein product [Camellia sinensis]